MFLPALTLLFVAQAAPAPTEVELRLAIVDRAGNDVTKDVLAKDAKPSSSVMSWRAGTTDFVIHDVAFGASVRVPTRPDAPVNVQLTAPADEKDLVPGWAFVGQPEPGVTLEPGATGARRLQVVVARKRNVRLSWKLPDDISPTDSLRASGVLAPEEGFCREFSFYDLTRPTRVLTKASISIPSGRYEVWGTSKFQWTHRGDERSLFAHTTVEVEDVDHEQPFVIDYKRGVEVRGRLVEPTGAPIQMTPGQTVFLGPPTLARRTFGALQPGSSDIRMMWSFRPELDGTFRIVGLPPGQEFVCAVSGPQPTGHLKIPLKDSDVGDVVLDLTSR
jgi:hypothetical protein